MAAGSSYCFRDVKLKQSSISHSNGTLKANVEENENKTLCWSFVTHKSSCHQLRSALVSSNLLDSSKAVQCLENGFVAMAICFPNNEFTSVTECRRAIKHQFSVTECLQSIHCSDTRSVIERLTLDVRQLHFFTKRAIFTQKEKLQSALKRFILQKGCEWSHELHTAVPNKWERHGDLVILPLNSFQQEPWRKYMGADLWCTIVKALSANRLARKSLIQNDDFRSSQVQLLLGSDGWATHIDNGIQYAFDVTKSMFCSGNITEKLRVASFDCQNQVVVDMFAGIGYFTLPFLIHAKAKLVHACEWNPVAVQALHHNLKLNNVSDRCVVHYGDNRSVTPIGIAQRVNLGLIPSSEDSWEAACKALDPKTGGILHIHGNVNSQNKINYEMLTEGGSTGSEYLTKSGKSLKVQWIIWAMEVSQKIAEILHRVSGKHWMVNIQHIEHVKCYAPHIDHMVVDLECIPPDINTMNSFS